MDEANTRHEYPHPPITEATIELRFRERLNQNQVAATSRHLTQHYPHEGEFKFVLVSVDMGHDAATVQRELSGFRRVNDDNTTVCVITEVYLATSVLAPYPGWNQFLPMVQRNYEILRREVGVAAVSRIGIRNINRIDIPLPHDGGAIRVSDYLRCYPEFPSDFQPVTGFALQGMAQLPDDRLAVTINQARIESPLIDHESIVLDIDVGRTDDIPFRAEAMWEVVGMMRIKKNMLFEACLTDRARELFA
jgi:uncharacterized protein (TIGR04255 family)